MVLMSCGTYYKLTKECRYCNLHFQFANYYFEKIRKYCKIINSDNDEEYVIRLGPTLKTAELTFKRV